MKRIIINQTGRILLAILALGIIGCDSEPLVPTTSSTTYSGILVEPLTLVDRVDDPLIADYCVSGKWIIESDLVIEPGVVICFEPDASLEIGEDGYMDADGTAMLPIRFTGSVPNAGSWRGIYFESPDLRNNLNFCIVEHAGSDEVNGIWYPALASVALRDISEVSITNTEIRNGLGYGIALEDESELRSFASNYIHEIENAAIYCSIDQIGSFDQDTRLTGSNGFDGVLVFESWLEEPLDQTAVAFNDGSNYRIGGDVRIRTGLYIEPGANIEVGPAFRIWIDDSANAFFNAVGTAMNNITITGQITSGPSWNGISFFSDDTRNNLSYCNISYAGNDPVDNIWYPGIQTAVGIRDDAALNVSFCTISNSGGCGLYNESGNGTLIQSDNTFTANVSGDVCN